MKYKSFHKNEILNENMLEDSENLLKFEGLLEDSEDIFKSEILEELDSKVILKKSKTYKEFLNKAYVDFVVNFSKLDDCRS